MTFTVGRPEGRRILSAEFTLPVSKYRPRVLARSLILDALPRAEHFVKRTELT